MRRIKIATLFVVMLLGLRPSFAQQHDTGLKKASRDSISEPKKAMVYVIDKFAMARPLNMEFYSTAAHNFNIKKGDIEGPELKMNSYYQAKANMNIHWVKKKNWLLSTTHGYSYTHMEVEGNAAAADKPAALDKDFQYLSSSLNFSYFSSAFKKRMIYNASVVVDGSEQHLERVKGLASAVMVLKGTLQTKMAIGVMVNIDPSTQIPVIPVFTYEHKFNSGLIVDLTLPKSAYLRKHVFSHTGRISMGSELNVNSFYLYNVDATAQKYEYRQIDINSGLMYEHALGHFVFTGKAGVRSLVRGRAFKKEDSFDKPVAEVNADTPFYFNVGVSFNPFTMLKRSK